LLIELLQPQNLDLGVQLVQGHGVAPAIRRRQDLPDRSRSSDTRFKSVVDFLRVAA
jgi:hypothetical protein